MPHKDLGLWSLTGSSIAMPQMHGTVGLYEQRLARWGPVPRQSRAGIYWGGPGLCKGGECQHRAIRYEGVEIGMVR